MDFSFLKKHKIIPVVVFNFLSEVVPKLTALKNGGISVAEITFRTECAKEAIALAVQKMPDMLIGAGTVIDKAQCIEALEAGAKFIVSPGLSEEVFEVCLENNVPYIAGAVTPTEIINAIRLGLNIIKFFPSAAFGGIKTIKDLSAVFPTVSFLPTGGINTDNFIEYLSKPFVAAVGGSWMMSGSTSDIENATARAIALLTIALGKENYL